MSPTRIEPAVTIEILLGNELVGYLTHYRDGKNILMFDETYKNKGSRRSTLSLSFSDPTDETRSLKKLNGLYASMHSLPTFFHNLLPEGGLKDYIIQSLKINDKDEFNILMALKDDLPGNIEIRLAKSTPEKIADSRKTVITEQMTLSSVSPIHFSLAGIQIKFSMLFEKGHYTLKTNKKLADYIIKTPSIIHANLPENEYAMMRLAEAVGVNIPEIKLVKLESLIDLPEINLPNEQYAYGIKRFDRVNNQKYHIEDFAQVLDLRNTQKYGHTNYETMAKIIQKTFTQSSQALSQFIKRLLVNILLGNTDAHIKNWSVRYEDGILPTLAPAYDIICSLPYIENREVALNMGRLKNFYAINQETLNYFARRIDLPVKVIHEITDEIITLANASWPSLIENLPIDGKLKKALRAHWRQLQKPFSLIEMS